MTEKRPHEKTCFWFDVRKVASSHAEVTANIAGLALALLLIVPIFDSGNPELTRDNNIVTAMLAFFFALAFGALAAFIFSVLSGDARTEGDRLLAFVAPSVAFGTSIALVFLGFVHLVAAYVAIEGTVFSPLRVMRLLVASVLAISLVIMTRTVFGVIRFARQASDVDPTFEKCKELRASAWFSMDRKNLIFSLVGFMIALVVRWMGWGPGNTYQQGYFWLLTAMWVGCMLLYAFSSYVDHEIGETSRMRWVMGLSKGLWLSYVIVVWWSVVSFL